MKIGIAEFEKAEGRPPFGDEWSPNDVPDLFVLGCNHRLITIHSQQVRAANLVDRLASAGNVKPGVKIAVIGAGFGGLTVAACALRYGASVTILEKRAEPLALQASCRSRWVHPTIYEWPATAALEEDTTQLPVLNWTASTADRVAEQVRGEWNEIRWRDAERLQEHYQTVVKAVSQVADGRVEVIRQSGSLPPVTETFNIAIVAVGFGLERTDGPGCSSYWADEDGVRTAREGERWLVSGFGDGALADVLRIVIGDFRPDEIVEFLQEIPPDGELLPMLIRFENDAMGAVVEPNKQRRLDNLYREQVRNHPEAADLREQLRSVLVEGLHLVIQGRPESYLYGTTSAVANRFLVAQIHAIYESDDFEGSFTVLNEVWTEPPVEVEEGRFEVRLPSLGDECFFDGFVQRHGPRSELEKLADVYAATEERRGHLRAHPQLLDPSRIRTTTAPRAKISPKTDALPPWEEGTDECLVLTTDDSPPLGDFVEFALRPKEFAKNARAITGRPFRDEPLVVDIRTSLQNLDAFKSILERLCVASVVVADISNLDPGMLFLLGVRAAVRRGVTIAAMHPYPTLIDWGERVPFNLRELSLQRCAPQKIVDGQDQDWHQSDADHPGHAIRRSILTGLKAVRRDSTYQDLPGFAEVRVGKDGWTQRSAGPDKMILFLGPYDGKAQKTFGSLSNHIGRAFKNWVSVDCQRIIDEKHLGLTTHRLYEAARYARFCIVDWTGWKANVFFEFGVRAAVSPFGALSMVEADWLESQSDVIEASPTRDLLLKMFGPEPYRRQGSTTPYERVRDLAKRTDEQPLWPIRPRTGGVPQSFVYKVVSQKAVTDEDPFLNEIQTDLIGSVDGKFSKNVTGGESEVTALYASDNDDLVKRYNDAQLERLLAAFYYLDQRHGLRVLKQKSERRRAREFVDVGERLGRLLRGDPNSKGLLKRIHDKVLKVATCHPKVQPK